MKGWSDVRFGREPMSAKWPLDMITIKQYRDAHG